MKMNLDAVVFSGGSDPDDVHGGSVIQDSWLLSAVSMLAAAGGVGDGGIDEQIARLIVHRLDPIDGSKKYDSPVGAYAVRLFKNGQWETIVSYTKPSETKPSQAELSPRKTERMRLFLSLLLLMQCTNKNEKPIVNQ